MSNLEFLGFRDPRPGDRAVFATADGFVIMEPICVYAAYRNTTNAGIDVELLPMVVMGRSVRLIDTESFIGIATDGQSAADWAEEAEDWAAKQFGLDLEKMAAAEKKKQN